MIGTDRYSYFSKLRRVDPVSKLVLSAVGAAVCIGCNSIAVGLCTLALMWALTAWLGGIAPRVFGRMLRVPLSFLILGCIPVFLRSYPAGTAVVVGVPLGRSVWGLTGSSIREGVLLCCKAFGVIGAVYFTTLTTPMTDLTVALRRLHVPQLFVELMELMYRFIFVLMDTMRNIRTAQESRLGYMTFRQSYQSMGTLISMVFLRAYRKSDRVYAALESRGYQGVLTTLSDTYEDGRRFYLLAAAVAGLQLAVYILERGMCC